MIKNEEQNFKKEKKLLKPKNDIVFQSLFSSKNEKITKAFAEALLEEKIDKIVINSTKELYREKPDDKLGILDLELDINNKEKVDVEIQLVEREDFSNRLLYYFSRLYAGQAKRGSDYDECKRVVIIAIIDYELELTKDVEKMETKWKLRETKNPHLVLTDEIEICIIELPKVRREYEKNKNNEKAQWMMFLDNPNTKEVEDIVKNNEEIKDAVVEVHKMTEDEKMRKLAELREKAIMDEKAIEKAGFRKGKEKGLEQGIEQGIAQGLEQGLKQGEEKKKKQIINKLKEKGFSKEEIMKMLDLSENEFK